MVPTESIAPSDSVAEVGCLAESSMMKSSVPKCTVHPGTSPLPMAGYDPAWIATSACACPTVGAKCHRDFMAILMI